MPRYSLTFPRSRHSHIFINSFLILKIVSELFPMKSMSSTYMTHINISFPTILMYIPESKRQRLNPKDFKDLSTCLFQACDACLSPYSGSKNCPNVCAFWKDWHGVK